MNRMTPHRQPYRRSLERACAALLLWSLFWPAMVLAAGPESPAEDWMPSPDGQWLRQRSTGLVWQRCMLGMRWNGRDCAGEPRNNVLKRTPMYMRPVHKSDEP